MERIKETGIYTGKIVRAEHKNYFDKAQGVVITMNVDGKCLTFILIIERRNGDDFYTHKGEQHMLPGAKSFIEIKESLGIVDEDIENNFYNSLEGKELSVYIKSCNHIIKRHEFVTNELVRVIK